MKINKDTKFLIVGLGLIGGSYAKALKKQGKLTDAEISEVTKVPLQDVAAMPAL